MITKPTYWTRWRVRRTLATIVQELTDEEKLPPSKRTYFAKSIFARRGIHSEIVRRWGQDYGDDEEICASVSLLKEILEARNVEGALKNHINSFIAMFNLKNNYDWKEDPTGSEREDRKLEMDMLLQARRLSEARKLQLPPGQV